MTANNLARELGLIDGVGQADLLRRKQITARELVQSAIDRIEAGNPSINAVVHKQFEQALAEAEKMSSASVDSPLAGVPFLLKDGGCAQAGVPQTQGNIALKRANYTPEADSPLGSRFRECGLITVGVSNMPEFGMLGDTQPLAFGPTRNPSALDRSASGSSGGAAAAVAAGFVPIAHAGDGAGSTRQPAAWCGVVGLKPSRGRMPRPVGPIDDLWSSHHVITRTVRDTAAALDAVNGALPGDLYSLAHPQEGYLASLRRPQRGLRVAILTTAPNGIVVDPECSSAVQETGRLLQDAGHQVELTHPPALLESIPEWVNQTRGSDLVRSAIDSLERLLRRPVDENDVEPTTWEWFQQSKPVSAEELRACLSWHLTRSARILQWWEEQRFDLLVTPITNAMPDRLADLADQSPMQTANTERRHATFLEPFNASGQPAIGLPARWTDEGIPVGIQIVAGRGQEHTLLQAAAQLEDAIGWPARTT